MNKQFFIKETQKHFETSWDRKKNQKQNVKDDLNLTDCLHTCKVNERKGRITEKDVRVEIFLSLNQ